MPESYADDYHRSIARLVENVSLHRNEAWDQSMLLSAAAAQAVAKGHVNVAEALLNLDAEAASTIRHSSHLPEYLMNLVPTRRRATHRKRGA